MNLKSLLKVIKENESKLSTLLGMAVILIFGVVAINYFRNMNQPEELTLPAQSDEQIEGLPATHVVGEGENLWKIAETYYKSGYNWVDIAEANEIPFPGNIETGQELSIPAVEAKKATVDQASPLATVETPQEAPTKVPTSTPDPVVVLNDSGAVSNAESYTVERGDSLWKIAQKVYGDPYKWVEIARENKLINPDLIHAGNVFVIPR
ncbi:hypothetical protein A3D84_00970 [Candidatus Woesebacteria bacterium RIFCSPHIGHO2_02_FULL_42_20]|uniref:LysM domain-containing protein n=1 Tax=Candidatus Woesebacteria bacterium RIFCSPHIGHO2_12_FULL_41_24 TaxID=1802510 RepID=A0A1F8AQ51_9BACT|nr:MAG: hypothetical protein A2W15_05195 [Candidatus Woesebacteria bacterium RBG_16_41_13]OGM30689.1 MAG: hypothetical protein A2873_01090 [Candidatus Woesebacteria bacterium RIFCSPHIGHO2_01_FULL_42_80]OGM35826.1 MAG: hypothetical protein A3D84_00970 [Candidatus Woesebacteria bacterium RIFCSPHIGHO2_02_FULL_42_20]OGM53884.1 MAG: hypothetical protein A3E44_05735 [Candidatus Woesebacteria bacterium RIFCSPHIGHO2_12_FULL_41_24]OGM66076.1 MAG: hypothetical protein A2969_03830 [Candidatus Woesebacteri